MRLLTFTLLFMPFSLFAQKQHFEGIVKFSQTYQCDDKQFDLKSYKAFFGDSFTSYIKPGFYRQDYFNSTGVNFVLYHYNSNRYYYKLADIDTLFYEDCSKSTGTSKVEKTDSVINILNHPCNLLKFTTDYKNSQIFYAKDLFIDPVYFKDHKMGGYDLITAATESVYLKIVSDYGLVKSTIEAILIEEKKLDDSIFELPPLPLKEN